MGPLVVLPNGIKQITLTQSLKAPIDNAYLGRSSTCVASPSMTTQACVPRNSVLASGLNQNGHKSAQERKAIFHGMHLPLLARLRGIKDRG